MAIRMEIEKYFANDDEEKDIAQKLDEGFDISHRGVHGDYSFWIAEPKKHTRERLGLQKEILVVYSNHNKPDMRVLRTIEYINQHTDFKHRVDKVLYLLIHKGDIEETQELFSSLPDRIIIPFQVEELRNPNRGNLFIRTRVAQITGRYDLFGMTSPITSDEYFFGRSELIQNLVTRSTIRKENSGLFGLRKTGKTSVLRALQRRLESRPILVEYVDSSNPGIHSPRWWQTLEVLVQRLSQSLRTKIRRDFKVQGVYTETTAGSQFLLDVLQIITTGQLDQVILMLDEIEYITHGLSGALARHWDTDFVPFWQTIRSVHQETQGKFVFLVAGVNPACVERSHFGVTPNPIFQLAFPHYLEAFTATQVREMVRTIGKYAGLDFSEDVYAYLQSYYGGHPFLVRIACSEVWKLCDTSDAQRRASVDVASFQRLKADIRQRLANPIKDILLSLVWWYPEEYELLQILAEGDAEFVSDYLKDQPDSMLQFAKYGILKQDRKGSFAIEDLQDFIRTNGERYRKEISPFTRGDMPPEILPEVPDLAILGQLFTKRTEIEIKLRNAIILYLGIKANWEPWKLANLIANSLPKRADRKEPRDMFIGRAPKEVINELYTIDLKHIIKENWDVFSSLFDGNKVRFEMNMDTLNIARRVDAHTKPLTYDEKVEFENSYAWILARLSKVPMQ